MRNVPRYRSGKLPVHPVDPRHRVRRIPGQPYRAIFRELAVGVINVFVRFIVTLHASSSAYTLPPFRRKTFSIRARFRLLAAVRICLAINPTSDLSFCLSLFLSFSLSFSLARVHPPERRLAGIGGWPAGSGERARVISI